MIPTSLKNADEHSFIQIKTQGSCTGDKLERKILSKYGEHQRATRKSQVGVRLTFLSWLSGVYPSTRWVRSSAPVSPAGPVGTPHWNWLALLEF